MTDEEIEKEAEKHGHDSMSSMAEGSWVPVGFALGAKWMRDKINSQHKHPEEEEK